MFMDKPWLSEYPPGALTDIDPSQYSSLVQMYEEACKTYQGRPAFSCHFFSLSYEKIYQLSSDFAAFLQHELKLVPGDRFAIQLPNLLQYPVVLFGALQAGLTVVNLNPLYTTRELEEVLEDAKPKAMVVLENFASKLQDIYQQTSLQHIIVTAVGDLYPFVKKQLVNFVVRHVKRTVPAWSIAPALCLSDALRQGESYTLLPVRLDAECLAFLQYTGGTTGHPKGVMLSHRNIIANLLQAKAWIGQDLRGGQEVMITALPLYHIFALLANLFLFVMLGGLNVLIPNPRDLKDFLNVLAKTPFTGITGVNTLYDALLHQKSFHELDFSHLRVAIAGGMSLQQKVAEQWQQVTGKPIVEGYGLSETSPLVTLNPLQQTGFTGSIGLPVASTEVKICSEQGETLGVRDIGEICVRGPQVMQGYWQNEHATQLALDDEGWFKTGDIAYCDERGYFYIVDRLKDIIVVSGFNVYPAEVENIIMELAPVREVAAVGVNSEQSGEQIKVYIVLNEGDLLTEDEVKAHCTQQLTAYKQPKIIEFIDELPKTVVGKVLRRALRE
ncbi:long-chain-fatty-acid--CoA ligase [Piscirickettsia salmonis]|nr:AMP-binding enzyme family protein [Piscirickettsia salmonis LF-89 = ATCC VR-1361]PEQ15963.1 long-chain-fatty-acid--CoA ligase [Piscirickettsia salmonis]WGZ71456.1 long-chain-fatty-acid--CoA ligase [Piscirickettsia salmonis EM-90]QHS32521.1 long-chain-fatty-acid--CoA ligase [Piscirickettsia salmonis]QIX55941.1 long-chain-fatty-acid--CoA ligase [Piscirickettsia salmonis]